MSLRFALPVFHSTAGGYPAAASRIVRRGTYRQALQTVAMPAGSVDGLELYLASPGDSAELFALFDGSLQVPAPGAGQTTLTLTRASPRNDRFLRLNKLEAPIARVEYANADRDAVRDRLRTLLDAGVAAADGQPANTWHPLLRVTSPHPPAAGAAPQIGRQLLDLDGDERTALRNQIVDTVLAGALAVPVLAGDGIGRAAAFRAGDTLPPATPDFDPGALADAARARRLTLRTFDKGGQPINPLWFLHVLVHAAHNGSPHVTCRTVIADGAALDHPLITACPDLAAAAPPAPRVEVRLANGNDTVALPVGDLGELHNFGPSSVYQWRYDDNGNFVAVNAAGAAIGGLGANARQDGLVQTIWNQFGATISGMAAQLHLPAELVMGLIGSESVPPAGADPYNERITRFEPLLTTNRQAILRAASTDAERVAARRRELLYDQLLTRSNLGQTSQTRGEVVVHAAGDERSTVDITLDADQRWPQDILVRRNRILVIGDHDRYRIRGNTFSQRVPDLGSGHSGARDEMGAGQTRFFPPAARSATGQAAVGDAEYHSGPVALNRLSVSASRNTLSAAAGTPDAPEARVAADATVTLLVNGAASALTVTLAGNAGAADIEPDDPVEIAAGDTLSFQVDTGGDQGVLRNLQIRLRREVNAPVTNVFRLTVANDQFEGGQPQAPAREAARARNNRRARTRITGGSTVYFPASEGVIAGGSTRRNTGLAGREGDTKTLPRAGTLRNLVVRMDENTLADGAESGSVRVRVMLDDTPTALEVLIDDGATEGADTTHTVDVAAGQDLWFEVSTTGATGHVSALLATVHQPPGDGEGWIPEAFVVTMPAYRDAAGDVVLDDATRVHADNELTWEELFQVVDATGGRRVSPGVLQTLVSTAIASLDYLERVAPDVFTGTVPGVTARPPAADGARAYLAEWLVVGANSILAGAGYIRMGHAEFATGFDLPLVGAAYNAGSPRAARGADRPWGLVYFGNYVEHAAPFFNAAVDAFNAADTTVVPAARFVR